jgi:rhamnosyltransferase
MVEDISVPKSLEMMRTDASKVTVVMRTKNSAWVVREALDGLFAQNNRSFELIVVDSGSTDETLSIVNEYPCRLLEIEAGNYFPGAVLNMALNEVTSELVVFQNSDAIPADNSLLEHLLEPFSDSDVAATFARQLPRAEAEPWVRREYSASFPASGQAPSWMILSFAAAAIRRSCWLERPFYRDSWASEDAEWGAWAKKRGYKIIYVPDALVTHSHNYTLSELYGRRFVDGEADAFVHSGRIGEVQMAKRTVGALVRDVMEYVRVGQWSGIASIPARRAVDYWAYRKGYRHGIRRRLSGNDDAAYGQAVALTRHSERLPQQNRER